MFRCSVFFPSFFQPRNIFAIYGFPPTSFFCLALLSVLIRKNIAFESLCFDFLRITDFENLFCCCWGWKIFTLSSWAECFQFAGFVASINDSLIEIHHNDQKKSNPIKLIAMSDGEWERDRTVCVSKAIWSIIASENHVCGFA
jgi:hypothetical protein